MPKFVLQGSQVDAFMQMMSKLNVDYLSADMVSVDAGGMGEASGDADKIPVKTARKYTRITLHIPNRINTAIEEAVKKFGYAQYWYEEFHDAFHEVFDNREFLLMLSIIAAVSPRTDLTTNLRAAVPIFDGFITDYKKNPDATIQFSAEVKTFMKMYDAVKRTNRITASTRPVLDEYFRYVGGISGAADVIKNAGGDDTGETENLSAVKELYVRKFQFTPYRELKLFRAFQDKLFSAAINSVVNLLNYFHANWDNISRESLVTDVFKNMFPGGNATTSLNFPGGKNAHGVELITSHKVWNFILNLLDPQNDFTKMIVDNRPYYPVTIDTWMIRFLWDTYTAKESAHAEKSQKVFANTKGLYKEALVYINKQAAKFGMKPHQLQAIVWLAAIQKGGTDISDKTFAGAVEKNIGKISEEIEYMKSSLQIFNTLKSYIQKKTAA